MATYEKTSGVSGNWVKGSEVKSGTKCRLVSETNPTPSQFKDKNGAMKMQDVSKIVFDTNPSEPLNINLNRATINGLIDAFGNESKGWVGKMLTAQTEKVMVSGKRVTAVYLIPDGYEMTEDANGYVVIVKQGTNTKEAQEELPVVDFDEEPKIDEVPF